MSHVAASLAGDNPGPTAEHVKVPLLAQLLADETGDRRRVWADLGSAQSGLVEQLTGGRNRLIVADLPGALGDDDAQWHLPDQVLEEAFWFEPVDYFLCWDLLNYMSLEQLGELSRRVARRTRAESRVHALIQYSGTSMSETPGRYDLEADGLLRVARVDARSIGTPRYSPKALEKAMPDLRVERTMLLNNGMQEFMFGIRR
ncbi:MAG TPA: hypothetical protein VJ902_08420 [Wenzhouxiangellaceae bacterium]|nr:hypothetical protein [Wenzhouxiangellaceae bacterium]